MTDGQAGKSDKRRPPNISREEYDLRWALMLGHITFARFEERYRGLVKQGKVYRRY